MYDPSPTQNKEPQASFALATQGCGGGTGFNISLQE